MFRGVTVNRLTQSLQQCREQRRLLLVGFLPAGWPERAQHESSVAAAFDAGIDALEIAVPNPPLLMDGPLLRRAAAVTSREVTDAADALTLAARGRADRRCPLIALFYRHAAEELGLSQLLDVCVEAGADAVLMPEHPFAEQLQIAEKARARGLEQVLFLHLEDDLPLLTATGLDRPVIYMQSADLQTGGPFDADKARERLGELREALGGRDAFVLVGFGVHGAEEVGELADSSADGVIVGTALTRAAEGGTAPLVDLVTTMLPALARPCASSGV